MAAFTGFPLAGLDFYEDLEADNSKAFWTAHKEVWEESVREPMKALMAELEPDFGTARIFRPYRDVRFAKDKSPYKTHQGAVVRIAPFGSWNVQISAAGLRAGGGVFKPAPDRLAALRTAIDDEVRGTELEKLVAQFVSAGYEVTGDKLATKPKGYPLDHPRIELLRHKSLVVGKNFGAPAWLDTPRAAREVRAVWEELRPFIEWLGAIPVDY